MVESFYSNTVNLTDNRGCPYYFELDDFFKRFGKLKNGWILVSVEEYIEFFNN